MSEKSSTFAADFKIIDFDTIRKENLNPVKFGVIRDYGKDTINNY